MIINNSVKINLSLFVLTGVMLISSCNTFYKFTSANSSNAQQTAASVKQLQSQERYFILRSGHEAFAMKHMVLSQDQTHLQVMLDTLPAKHELFLTHGLKGKMIYHEAQSGVLTEVHIFISPDSVIKKVRQAIL